MSCDSRRKQFLSAVAGTGSPAATALGGPEAAQHVLEQVFTTVRDDAKATPPDAAGRALAEARTRALFSQFTALKVPVPSHAADGLPNRPSQVAYSVLHQTLTALTKGQPLPAAARAVVDREAARRRISAVARDKQGRHRCANCGQYARPNDHLCRQTATGDALRAKLQRTFGVPTSAYPSEALDDVIRAARSPGGLVMRHGLTGEAVTVTLDGLAMALANGFVPQGWTGASAPTLVELPGGRVVPVLNATGLSVVAPTTAIGAAAAASGAAIPPGTPLVSLTGALPAVTVGVTTEAIGTPASVSGGTVYDRGHFFGTEFKKTDSKGQKITVLGREYTIGDGSGKREDHSTARRTKIEPPPMYGKVVAGRTLVCAVGLLAEGQIIETDSGQIELYASDGNLLAVYDPSSNTVGDTGGAANASAEQMAAVLAHRALHPETPEDAALAADLIRLTSGAATPLAASDAAYIALKNGVFNRGGTLMMGGSVTAGKCPNCGQFTGAASHVCPSSPGQADPAGHVTEAVPIPRPAQASPAQPVQVTIEAPPVTVNVEAPQVTAQLDADAFAEALKTGLAGLSLAAPAAIAGDDLAELRDAMTEMAKAVSALASAPVQNAPPAASATDDRLVAILEKLSENRAAPAPAPAAATPEPVAQPALAQPRERPQRQAAEPTPDDQRTHQEAIFARVRRAEPDPSLAGVDQRLLDPNMTWTNENVPPADPDYYLNEQSAKIMKSMAAVLEAGATGNKANRTRAFSIYGPPGTGKNKLLEQVAASIQTVDAGGKIKQGLHYEEVDIYPDSDPEKLIGGTVIVSDGRGGTETRVRLGPIGQAAAMGSVIALNEVVRNPRMLTTFQSMLEKGYFQIEAPELGIVRIPVHPATIMAMTWNPGLEGDADRPAMAPLSRTIPFKLDRATPDEQGAQVNAYFATFPDEMRPSEVEARTSVAFLNAVTDLVYGNEVGRLSKRSKCVPGPRELNNFILLGKQVGWETALETMKVYCDQNSEDFDDQFNRIKLAYEMQFGEIGTNGEALYNPPAQI
jgi:hypothetical protein